MSAHEKRWMIYGATGYTGTLIAELAFRQGLKPILAGRNRLAVEKLAAHLGGEGRTFSLEAPETIQIQDCQLVLHCAGPFSATSQPMIAACVANKVHYLDITGELDCIEAAAAWHDRALAAGSVVLPAVGFDVVPSDCLAAQLARDLPGATQLEIAIAADSRLSAGTARTAIEWLSRGGRVRRDGKIIKVPTAWKVRQISFEEKSWWGMTVPLADVATGFYSTGIPNIEVYLILRRWQIFMLRRLRLLLGLTRFRSVQRMLNRMADRRFRAKPNSAVRAGKALVWARVSDAAGNERIGVLHTSDPYLVTSEVALAAVQRVLSESMAGFKTPSLVLGPEFIESIPGAKIDVGSPDHSGAMKS